MSADDRFKDMFFEEARELLLGLEEGLMELERRRDDRAHLDKTFRAAHSLKGAAAMVGLAALAEFTNLIESVLDRIRSGKLEPDSEVISALLDGRDHLAVAVEAEAAASPIAAPVDLSKRLNNLLRDRALTPPPPPPPAPPPKVVAPPPAVSVPVPAAEAPEVEPPLSKKPSKPRKTASGESKTKTKAGRSKKASKAEGPDRPVWEEVESDETGPPYYRISFKPGPDLLRKGANPLGVLDELRELGPTRISADISDVPTLEEMDPERCYVSWTVEVETELPKERLEDVFLFVAEDSHLKIERRRTQGAPAAATVEQATSASGPAPARPPALPPIPLPPPPPPPPPAPTPAGPAAKPSGPAPAAKVSPRIRVDAGQLDNLVGLAGELAVLSDNLQGLRELEGSQAWVNALEALDRVGRLIRDTTLELRMVPVEELFSRFPRVVRDLADRFGKEIQLKIVGQETRLDRTIVEKLSDPMIHLIRNAVDHALESPGEREASGKPRAGTITLIAGHEGDRVAIKVQDDGRGLNRERIVARGIARGLVPVGTSAEDPRVDTLIFEPGFSTRDEVSDISGRGVGLDVVRDAVRGLRGSLAVDSVPGRGTTFIFRLPLTLALIDGLLVECGKVLYVVPLTQVEECVALNGAAPALSKGRPCVSIRGELVPMVPLRTLFSIEEPPPPRQELLLTRHAGQRVGVTVDRLIGRVQAVIQSLGEGMAKLNRFSGATILGDGSVSLILDLAALVSESRTLDFHRNHHPPA